MTAALHTSAVGAVTLFLLTYIVGVASMAILAILASFLVTPAAFRSEFKLDILTLGQPSNPSVASATSAILSVLVGLSAWPVLLYLGGLQMAASSERQWASVLMLKPVDRRVAVFSFTVVMFILAAAQFDLVWQPALIVATAIILTGIVARHLSYLMGPLPDRLRKSPLQPYFTFVLIAACDVSTVVGGAALLYSKSNDFHVSLPEIKAVALDLFTLRPLIDIARGPLSRVPISLLGLLIAAVLLKSLIQAKQFTRTDDDLLFLANANLFIGRYREAQSWLVRQTDQSDYTVRAGIELGLGRFDRAMDYMGRAMRAAGETDELDALLLGLWGTSATLPFTPQQRLAVVEKCLQLGMSDAAALTIIDQCYRAGRVPAAVLKRLIEGFGHAYPLSLAAMMTACKEYSAASKVLHEAQPGTPLGELIRTLYLGGLALLDPAQPAGAFAAWFKSSFHILSETAKGISKEGDRRHAASLLTIIQRLASIAYPTYAESLGLLANDLADSPEDMQEIIRTQSYFGSNPRFL